MVEHPHKVSGGNGGCLLVIHFYTTLVLLPSTVTNGYTPCPISGHARHTSWRNHTLEDMSREEFPMPSKTSNHDVYHL